ncbi:murein biosynthesis integral membrane protein MurJ [Rubinisphaera margarita]|uniref:murein biosynthesis integral membrane protein MurJ n=1 Tax=Rubinisphaera margarita TaxID=2909586 RepID=UPI001EE8529A|nr:murein biosynthesis integral membrane protein MurJ [Rubinisphaera margarita]MCG6156954.1 murein biosynthesis integral membrane protein MurJ [Rubinisphaera margarita]
MSSTEQSSMESNGSPAALPKSSPHWMRHVRHVGLLTLVSRILGLLRDIGMAALFGNGPLLDAFTLAFRLPNLSRRLFGEGALTTAFLPKYVAALEEDRTEAEELATAVLGLLVGLLSLLTLFASLILYVLLVTDVLGASSRTMLILTAQMLPYVVLICLTAQMCAMLNAEGIFATPAAVPIVLNAVWIVAVFCLAPRFSGTDRQMEIIVLAILIGGVLQVGLPAAALWMKGFRLRWRSWQRLRAAWRIFVSMMPIVFGLSITQINAICDGALAWWFAQPEQGEWIAPGSASALYFGQRMYQFPLGIFGVAMGTVLFARLAMHVKSHRRDLVAHDVHEGLRFTAVIGLPASAGMMILAHPIASALLERGQFDAFDTLQTAQTIVAYGSGVWAYLGITVLQRVFYAMNDARTPVRIGLTAVGLNLVLNFPLMLLLGGAGLAWATAIAAALQVVLLQRALRTTLETPVGHPGLPWTGKVLLATFLMSAAVLGGDALWPESESKMMELLALAVSMVLAVFVYAASLQILQVDELARILGFRGKREAQETASDLDSNRHEK